jgi:hypothetical protein
LVPNMGSLLHDHSRRITWLAPEVFPSSVAYYDTCRESFAPLWWCVDRLYVWFRDRGDAYSAKDWLKKFRRLVGDVDDLGTSFTLRTLNTPSSQISHVCTTRCVITCLWQAIVKTKSTELQQSCFTCICEMLRRVLPQLPDDLRIIMWESNWHSCGAIVAVGIDAHGVATRFGDILALFPHAAWTGAIENCWNDLLACGELQGPMRTDHHNVLDIVTVLVKLPLWRRARRMHDMCPQFWFCLGSIRKAIVSWSLISPGKPSDG